MSDSVALMGVALLSIAKIFLVSAAGYVARVYPKGNPLMSSDFLRKVSRLLQVLAFPALTLSSVGAVISWKTLTQSFILIFGAFIIKGLSYWVIRLLCLVLNYEKRNSHLYRVMYHAVSTPNAPAFPLLYFSSLCELEIVNEEYGSDSNACIKAANGRIFIFLIGWYIIFWGVYFPYMEDISTSYVRTDVVESGQFDYLEDEDEVSVTGYEMTSNFTGEDEMPLTSQQQQQQQQQQQHRRPSQSLTSHLTAEKLLAIVCSERCKRIIREPNIIALAIGLVIGITPFLSDNLFGNPLSPFRPIGGAIETLGSPAVPLITMILAASLHTVSDTPSLEEDFEGGEEDDFYDEDDANIGVWRKRYDKYLPTVLFVVVRLAIVPAILIPLIGGIYQAFHPSIIDDKLVVFIFMILSASPSAVLVMASTARLGLFSISGQIAPLYFAQYVSCSFFMVLWTSIAISYIY